MHTVPFVYCRCEPERLVLPGLALGLLGPLAVPARRAASVDPMVALRTE